MSYTAATTVLQCLMLTVEPCFRGDELSAKHNVNYEKSEIPLRNKAEEQKL